MPALLDELVAIVARRGTPEAREWLSARVAEVSTTPAAFAPAFAAAGRKLGKQPITEDDARGLSIPWPVTGLDECGRAALVLAALATRAPDEHVTFVRDLIRRGEVRERQAVLRVFAALPDPDRFVELAIDACRNNVPTVFEAIACDNAYPARRFPDPAFRQLVLKALFVGTPVGRIVDLDTRIDDELVRMVEAYASERRAAGRSVPVDAELIRRP